ncbi:MAG: alanine racemase [Chlamydiota bacterium]|jgi:alanine racemase
MGPSNHPAWIEVNLRQFQKNIRAIRSRVGSARVCLPVKANAYGHGLIRMAQNAVEAGVDALGVAFLSEAAALRHAGVTIPIVVFGAIHENQIPDLIDLQLEFSISSRFKAELVSRYCRQTGRLCKVHIEVDTGMQRTGLRPESAVSLIRELRQEPHLEVVGVYSHLATSDRPGDPFAMQQIDAFYALQKKVGREETWHLANSGGVAYYPDAYFDMVRPGLLAYGYYPDGRDDPRGDIAPCFALKAKISYFKVVLPNTGISYGHTYRTAQQTRVVTVPVGYGDGYRRGLSNVASVAIRGKKYPIAGTICMDQFMVDIGQDEAYVGDEVTLIGTSGPVSITLQELTAKLNTTLHDTLSGWHDRLPRIYLN